MKIRERSENLHYQGGGVDLLGGGQKILFFKGGCPIRWVYPSAYYEIVWLNNQLSSMSGITCLYKAGDLLEGMQFKLVVHQYLVLSHSKIANS